MAVDLSSNGTLFIASFEGFVAHCYDDGGKPGVGNCTIGYGHLVHLGPTRPEDRKKWDPITKPMALSLLHKDASAAVSAIRTNIKIPLTQGQVDALVSLGYNCGPGAIQNVAPVVNSKPKVWRLVAIRQWRSRVTDAFLQWDHANGQVLAGLQRRRSAEAHVFCTGKYTKAQGNSFANA